MPTHSTHSTDNQATTPSDRLRAFLRPSGVQAMPRIASPAVLPCEATQTPRMAYGVAYGLAQFDGLRASQNPFDGFAHVLGRIEQSNGLKIDFRRHSSDRPPDDQATKPDARRT
jgi:hypothetical protein